MSIQKLREIHREAILQSVRVVSAVGPDDLVRPTPCEGWILIDLLRHMIVQHKGFAEAASGRTTAIHEWAPSLSDRDLVLEYIESSVQVIRAFADETLVGRRMLLPEISRTDTISAQRAMGFHLVDYVVHGWDVAKTIGIAYQPGDSVAAAALNVAQQVPNGPQRSKPGSAFAPSVLQPSDASPIDQIVALLGRSPQWTNAQRKLPNGPTFVSGG